MTSIRMVVLVPFLAFIMIAICLVIPFTLPFIHSLYLSASSSFSQVSLRSVVNQMKAYRPGKEGVYNQSPLNFEISQPTVLRSIPPTSETESKFANLLLTLMGTHEVYGKSELQFMNGIPASYVRRTHGYCCLSVRSTS